MVDINKAVSYIRSRGDEIEKARLACILYQEPCPKSVLEELSQKQFPDGGFS
jgi:hypothetical protein